MWHCGGLTCDSRSVALEGLRFLVWLSYGVQLLVQTTNAGPANVNRDLYSALRVFELDLSALATLLCWSDSDLWVRRHVEGIQCTTGALLALCPGVWCCLVCRAVVV